jgi:hypothetical protein
MSTNYSPDAIPPKSGVKTKSVGKRAVLAALVGAAAVGALTLIAPLANAAPGDPACGGTTSVSSQDGHRILTCTETDKKGVKTACTYKDGVSQGCMQVAHEAPPVSHPPVSHPPVVAQPPVVVAQPLTPQSRF